MDKSYCSFANKRDIIKAVNHFDKNNCDNLFSIVENNVHFIYQNKPINFNKAEKIQKTQDLNPVLQINYNIMSWNSKKFLKNYKKFGYAFFSGKISTFKTSKISNIIVKYEDDIKIIKKMMGDNSNRINYDKIIKKI